MSYDGVHKYQPVAFRNESHKSNVCQCLLPSGTMNKQVKSHWSVRIMQPAILVFLHTEEWSHHPQMIDRCNFQVYNPDNNLTSYDNHALLHAVDSESCNTSVCFQTSPLSNSYVSGFIQLIDQSSIYLCKKNTWDVWKHRKTNFDFSKGKDTKHRLPPSFSTLPISAEAWWLRAVVATR